MNEKNPPAYLRHHAFFATLLRVLAISLVFHATGIHSVPAQNAPVSTLGSVVSYGNTAAVQVTATNITNTGSFSLKISYDQSVADPTAVNISAAMGGSLSVNLNNPGFIFLSWYTYPGVTLTGNPVILTIDFVKVANGTSSLAWVDDGFSCSWYDGNSVPLNDVPISTYYLNGSVAFASQDAPHTILPSAGICQGSSFAVPVKVTNFNNIGKISLTMHYNSTALAYQSFINDSGFPGLTADGSQPGTVLISGMVTSGGAGLFLPDSAILITLNFILQGGSTGLTWYDLGASCQYSGPPPSFPVLNDIPQNAFYDDGNVTALTLPGTPGPITGPAGGNVCTGQTGVNFSVDVIPGVSAYVWSLPPAAVVTSGAGTQNITVSFGSVPGFWDVTVNGNNLCGNGSISQAFPLYINAVPEILSQPVSPDTVNAGSGIAVFTVSATGSLMTYQWQEYMNSWNDISEGGFYSGVYTPVLTITNPVPEMDGRHYRCAISGICPPGATTNGESLLSVTTVSGLTQPGAAIGNAPVLSVYPNPSAGVTYLQYSIPAGGHVILEISNIYGVQTDVLVDARQSRGTHTVETKWQTRRGIYIVVLSVDTGNGVLQTKAKMLKR